MERLKSDLERLFELNFLRNGNYLLDVTISQVGTKVLLSQESFLNKVLAKYRLKEYSPRYTSLDVSAVNVLSGEFLYNELLSAESSTIYKCMVGSITYTSMVTRLDVAHAAEFLGRYSAKLTKVHLAVTKHTLRYLKYMKSIRLSLPSYSNGRPTSRSTGTAEVDIRVFTDADFARDLADRKSTPSIAIYAFGYLIYWSSKKQSVVAQSTADAEFVASALAMLNAQWIMRVMQGIAIEAGVLKLFNDNQSALRNMREGDNY